MQNDFVTFSFIGGMDDENALVKADKIYFEGTAVASDGHRYTVNEKSDKTLMKRENQYAKHTISHSGRKGSSMYLKEQSCKY